MLVASPVALSFSLAPNASTHEVAFGRKHQFDESDVHGSAPRRREAGYWPSRTPLNTATGSNNGRRFT